MTYGSGEQYIDTNNIQLYVHAKIVRPGGINLQEDNTIAPVNLLLHSLFLQVDVSLNGTLIFNSTNTYPCRAMLEMLLSYGSNAKASQLTSEMYYKETRVEWTRFAYARMQANFRTRDTLRVERTSS